MAKDWLTDAQVDTEIERLNKSPFVQLARKERSIRYRRRHYLYDLRGLENRGRQLAEAGVTIDSLEAMMADMDDAEAFEGVGE